MTASSAAERQLGVLFNAMRDLELIADAHPTSILIPTTLSTARGHIRTAFDEISRLTKSDSLADVASNCDRISESMRALADRNSTPPTTLRSEGIESKKVGVPW